MESVPAESIRVNIWWGLKKKIKIKIIHTNSKSYIPRKSIKKKSVWYSNGKKLRPVCWINAEHAICGIRSTETSSQR